jgi:hypothetical protein
MSQQNQTDQKENKAASGQSMNGTDQPSAWEKAAEAIAGDNQLMATLLKLLLSPLTLIAGGGLIVYLFIKNKGLKDELEKLKEENKKLIDDRLLLSEESNQVRKKYKKLKKVFEVEQSQRGQLSLPEGTNTAVHNVNKNNISYLR